MDSESDEREKLHSANDIQSFEVDEQLDDQTTCGYGPFKGPILQKFATKKIYVIVFSVLGLFNAASWAYDNGTINTLEKRFKIPSKALGFMNLATNASQLFMSTVLGYCAGKGHIPRWIAFSQLMGILKMIITMLPHIIYGPGEEAILLTEQYGFQSTNNTITAKAGLCGNNDQCTEMKGSYIQPAILFLARFVGGIGGGLFYTAGVAYIDDNVKKTESPFIMSLSFFIRMIGPSVGYAIASASLKYYVSPWLTPTITPEDPRWIGCWWMGWIFFIVIISLLTIPISMFPKRLPGTAVKKNETDEAAPPSARDMWVTTKRLLGNRIFMFNTVASILYILGESPYWIFLAKYIEVQYHQSATFSNFMTGTMSLTTSATGILLSGFIIGKLRPSARSLAGWNVFVAVVASCGYISYTLIDCGSQIDIQTNTGIGTTQECNLNCGCENTQYAPVCSSDNQTFISACHAGCVSQITQNGSKIFSDCSCTPDGMATPGLCPTDCSKAFTIFLVVLAITELAASSGVSSNFLLSLRCVDEKDKSAAMGLSLTLLGVLGFGPAPVLYGYILDMTCVVWGKTCDGTGNCWLYNSSQLAYTLNFIAASFMSLGTLFDVGVWYYAKNLKIFD